MAVAPRGAPRTCPCAVARWVCTARAGMGIGTGWDGECQVHSLADGQRSPLPAKGMCLQEHHPMGLPSTPGTHPNWIQAGSKATAGKTQQQESAHHYHSGGRGEIGREPPEHSSGLMGQCQWLSEKEEQHITHFSLLKTSVTIWSRTALRLRWSWRQIRSDMALTS